MPDTNAAAAIAPHGVTCVDCGSVFPRSVLACPDCQRLVHAETLQRLQERAAAHAARGELQDELTTWRDALSLLPEGSRQNAIVRLKIEQLAAHPNAPAAQPEAKKSPIGKLTGLSALGLLLWKLKGVLVFLATKGKLLLFGMSKWSTLVSMALSVAVYFTMWGFWFALGFVLCIYVHEMGHVFALRRLGIPASAPMFVPGLGAFVRHKSYPATLAENAQTGLAGPLFGLGAGLVCYGLFKVTDEAIFAALAQFGCGVLNLLNMMPLPVLDGGHGFRALDRRQRWLATAAIFAIFFLSQHGWVLIVGLVAAGNAALATRARDVPARGDTRAFYTYVGLIAALAWLAAIQVPGVETAGASVMGGTR